MGYDVRIEFAQFGHFDSFSIYRSSSPMDPLSLPLPIVTGLATMYYIDEDLPNGTYFYRVLTVRGSESILSDEYQVEVSEVSVQSITNTVIGGSIITQWEVDGIADEIHYFCTTSPINVNTPPAPNRILSPSLNLMVYLDANTAAVNHITLIFYKNGNRVAFASATTEQVNVFSKLTFDGQSMVDVVSSNSWTRGTGNTYIADGKGGYALNFGGSGAATLSRSISKTDDFSVSCRFKATQIATDYLPLLYLGNTGSNTNRFSLYLLPKSGENVVRCYTQQATGTSATFDSEPVPINEWVTAGYKIKDGEQFLYLNGVLVATSTYEYSISSFTSAYLGAVRASSAPVYRSGIAIDDVCIALGL